MAFDILSPLHRATRQITLYLEAYIKLEDIDLSTDEGHALSYIAAYGPCPTGNVQRVLGVRRSTLSSMLKRLEKRGLITRSNDPNDARILLVEVSADGAAFAKEAEKVGKQLERKIRQQLQASDLVAFDRVIAAVHAATGVTVVDHRRPS